MDKTKECFDKLAVILREYDSISAMEAAVMLLGYSVSNIAVGLGWLSETERQKDTTELTAKVSQLVEDHATELKRRREAAT
jgi:anaerobic C4-dicarboxylate transporter